MLESLEDRCQCIVSGEVIKANMASAMARGLPLVQKNYIPFASNPRLAIVATGSSVENDLDELENWDGCVWAVNGALDYLIDHGIKPDAWVGMDPLEDMTKFLTRAPLDVTYYVASLCHPSVFAMLPKNKTVLWHAAMNECMPPEGQGAIGGGPNVMTRAPMLAYALGFRRAHLFGADSSFRLDGQRYADSDFDQAGDSDICGEPIWVRLNGRKYLTDEVYVHQVAYFVAIRDWFHEHDAEFEIHGQGLGPDILKAPIEDARRIA